MEYFEKAYFVYDEESAELIDLVVTNSFGTKITAIYIDDFLEQGEDLAKDAEHVVISIHEEYIPEFLVHAYKGNFSVGMLPLPSQKEFIKNIFASSDIEENLDIALQKNTKGVDLLLVNETIIYSQGVIGSVPLITK